MIPRAHITQWRAMAPWAEDDWVEQDLVLSRALVEMFSLPAIGDRLAFRGGTALYKLHLHPAARYSEGIDLVQVAAEPIGETLDLLRGALDPWLGTPQRKSKQGRVNLIYRFGSEGSPPVQMRLKIEINSREHFSELGLIRIPFRVDSRWSTGESTLTTYSIDELLGTKLRALYQRKKGRDLFDLWFALEQGVVNVGAMLRCFDRYMTESGRSVTRAQFEENLHDKAATPEFGGDVTPLLRAGVPWDVNVALETVKARVVARLTGEPWKGP